MGKLIDLTGQRFGRLVVIERAKNGKNRGARWICRCDCGNIKTIYGYNLRSGCSRSCGCLQKELVRANLTTHGMCKSKLYRVWCSMIGRCYRPAVRDFPIYGGRGITICEEWRHDFQAFYDWAMSIGKDYPLTASTMMGLTARRTAAGRHGQSKTTTGGITGGLRSKARCTRSQSGLKSSRCPRTFFVIG